MSFNVKVDKVPELEWWDEFFLPQPDQSEVKKAARFEGEL